MGRSKWLPRVCILIIDPYLYEVSPGGELCQVGGEGTSGVSIATKMQDASPTLIYNFHSNLYIETCLIRGSQKGVVARA